MAMDPNNSEFASLLTLIMSMRKAGYVATEHVTDTLQGCIIKAIHVLTGQRVAVKVTNVLLHNNGLTLKRGVMIPGNEDVIKEASILKYLTQHKNCPNTIIEFIDLFQGINNIFFVMSDGGFSLFDFVKRGHRLIESGKLDICEWHRVNKIIFAQMVESIDYIHEKQVAHFDVSLENFLINDIEIDCCGKDGKIKFKLNSNDVNHSVKVRLCDFGLSEYIAQKDENGKSLSKKFCGKTKYLSPEVARRSDAFEPKKNDIWCLGVSLFTMITGSHPWQKAMITDPMFVRIMNGDICSLLKEGNKLHYINRDLIELFGAFFKYEHKRIDMEKLKECTRKWSNNSSSN